MRLSKRFALCCASIAMTTGLMAGSAHARPDDMVEPKKEPIFNTDIMLSPELLLTRNDIPLEIKVGRRVAMELARLPYVDLSSKAEIGLVNIKVHPIDLYGNRIERAEPAVQEVVPEVKPEGDAKTYFAGCNADMTYEQFYQEHIYSDREHTLVASVLYNSARTLYPFAYKGDDVTKNRSDLKELQLLLLRMDGYDDPSRSQVDGAYGPATKAAIMKCQSALQVKYANIKVDGVPDQTFLKALANEGAKEVFYKEYLIREANTYNGRFNSLSYNVALAREIKGDFVGVNNPNYALLSAGEVSKDIEILAKTVWGEARGEGVRGMQAVASNIVNRFEVSNLVPALRPQFGWHNLAHVAQSHKQYSCWNKDDPNYVAIQNVTTANPEYRQALVIAEQAFWGALPDTTNNSDHYHTTGITKSWSSGQVAKIGTHRFFKRVNSPQEWDQGQSVSQWLTGLRNTKVRHLNHT